MTHLLHTLLGGGGVAWVTIVRYDFTQHADGAALATLPPAEGAAAGNVGASNVAIYGGALRAVTMYATGSFFVPLPSSASRKKLRVTIAYDGGAAASAFAAPLVSGGQSLGFGLASGPRRPGKYHNINGGVALTLAPTTPPNAGTLVADTLKSGSIYTGSWTIDGSSQGEYVWEHPFGGIELSRAGLLVGGGPSSGNVADSIAKITSLTIEGSN